ncbi:hypothetical protein CDL15_Pgr015139 [Punica granatum]|uniref:Uncharacterized protein n=1 Tax=Punica granatum TaxID=22663 RepID=A0A218VYY9_PUNGR|nr:hypothetical protein CDL15_Pgr015139 [Punica granatum]PKI62451.1 hypothetical protein CRG98_017257 [Punica granatum]
MLRFFRCHAAIHEMISYPIEARNLDTHFIQFIEWFKPLQQWEELFTEEARKVRPYPQGDRHVIVLFQQMWYVGPPRRRSTRAQGEPLEFQRTYSSKVWKTLLTDILDNDSEYREFQRIICEKNGVVPQVIWPPGHIPMEWDYQEDYQCTWPSLEQALKEYNEENSPPPIVSQDQQSPDPLLPLDSQDPYSPDPEASCNWKISCSWISILLLQTKPSPALLPSRQPRPMIRQAQVELQMCMILTAGLSLSYRHSHMLVNGGMMT